MPESILPWSPELIINVTCSFLHVFDGSNATHWISWFRFWRKKIKGFFFFETMDWYTLPMHRHVLKIFLIFLFRCLSTEMVGSAIDGSGEKKCSLYDHRPYSLFEDDYIRVCKIPKRKVGRNLNFLNWVNIIWIAAPIW